jgi:3-oxoacyl-[acyl-carrier protein] reductase
MDTLDLTGRTALITGASHGIGRAIATRLAADGVGVAIGYRGGQAEAEQLADAILAGGGQAVPVGGDVSDPAALAQMIAQAEAALGPLDILVSNAGRMRRHDLAALTVEEWDLTLAEHLRAAFLLTQRLVPGMRERGWGRILFVSSLSAFNGGFVGPHYAAAKAGQIGLMHSLAGTLAPHGVTVNTIAPALIATDGVPASSRPELTQAIPVGRRGQPEEVADLALAIIRNAYLTAQTILIDGGIHPR